MRPDSEEEGLAALDSPFPRGVGERASWSLGDLAVGVGAASLIYLFVSAAIAEPAVLAFGKDSAGAVLGQGVAVTVLDGGLLFYAYQVARIRGGGWRDLGLRSPWRATGGRPWTGGRIVGVILGAYVLAILLVNAYGKLVDILDLEDLLPAKQLPDAFFEHDWVLPFLGFSLVLMAPLAEEVFFRGFLFAGLRRHLAFLPAALISGVLFSFAHANPGLILPFTGVGMILAYTYERTGTLLAPAGVHFIFNLISFLALVFIPEWR